MQGAVGFKNMDLTANLPKNLPVFFLNRLRFDRIMVMNLWPTFLAHPVEVGTQQANGADLNTPQRALSRQTVAGRPAECKQLIFWPFLVGILTLKTVLQSAPEHVIFVTVTPK